MKSQKKQLSALLNEQPLCLLKLSAQEALLVAAQVEDQSVLAAPAGELEVWVPPVQDRWDLAQAVAMAEVARVCS